MPPLFPVVVQLLAVRKRVAVRARQSADLADVDVGPELAVEATSGQLHQPAVAPRAVQVVQGLDHDGIHTPRLQLVVPSGEAPPGVSASPSRDLKGGPSTVTVR